MNWDQIAGHEELKKRLKNSVAESRVSHAQLFVGKNGYGTLPLAIAYATEILKQENEHAESKVEHLNHLDLHFSFPVFTEKKSSVSKRFFPQFREMVLKNPYASFDDWGNFLESDNKQLFISADEVDELNEKFALKSFEGGSKILIIWKAEKMNVPASNKLLKFLEEPPAKTVIILVAEDSDQILPTILSRTQIVEIARPNDEDVAKFLNKNHEIPEDELSEIIYKSQGDLNEAQKLLKGDSTTEFEELFIQWVREAVLVKKKPELLKNIISWAQNIAGWNREKQKNFLDYCAEIFRLAMLQNYGMDGLVYKKLMKNGFKWENFSTYIQGANIQSILEEISTADYHLQRNGHAKIVWTDLGIKLSRYIHKPA